MEANEILKRVFGPEAPIELTTTNSKKEKSSSRVPNILNSVKEYMKTTITKDAQEKSDDRPGRIGPNVVTFDLSSHQGLCILSQDRLSIHSKSNFSTMRANTAVYEGKWMYELQLGSKGAMQVGWSTINCVFNHGCGVGDTMNSYAYDGNRVKKWNVLTHKYGEPWLTGDIIGCAIDLDNGKIDFYRNGKHMGMAFDSIGLGQGFAYFPTVSLALTESLTANFGTTPLRYPVKGYEPLQESPQNEITDATILFEWLSQIIKLIDGKQYENKEQMLHDGRMSTQAFLMCLSKLILKDIGPLLTIPYITEYVLIPFIQNLSESETHPTKGSVVHSPKLSTCLDLLWMFLQENEIKGCLKSMILCLLSVFRHVSLLLEYPNQCKTLVLLTKICQHTLTRRYMLKYLLFDQMRFANFMHIKPLDEGGLANIVNKVWWETNPVDPQIEANKTSYFKTCESIKAAISEVEMLQVEFLITLLNNIDGNAKRPTSRAIFLAKFKRFIQENMAVNRTPLPITLCCVHRLLVAFKVLWDTDIREPLIYIPCRVFYDATIDYSRTERLGGVLSHLHQTYKTELIEKLGSEHEVIVGMEQNQTNTGGRAVRSVDLPVVNPTLARVTNIGTAGQGNLMFFERLGFLSHGRDDRAFLRMGPLDSTISLFELLDSVILFYHVIAKKQIAKVADLRNSMSEYISAVQDTKTKLKQVKENNDPECQLIQQELERTINVFNTKLTEQARYMAWIRAAVYSEEKQSQLAWLLKVISLTLKNASKEGNLFSFVPDFFLDSLADLCIGLRSHIHPTVRIEAIANYKEMFLDIAEFLCEHFMDPRIVNVNSKGTLILTLAAFAFNPLTLDALENVPEESRLKVTTNLLKSYEHRAWAESNWILARFWQGNGFAFRYEKSPHLSKRILVGPKLLHQESASQSIKLCPSAVYQEHVRDVLLKNPKFLNSLLNQLNWAFSEFIEMVQEIQNVSSRPERVFIDSKQLKICATCFDLATSLLRVLEMIATVAPTIFTDPTQHSSENLLSRLCQLICQVLNRMSSQTSCFQHVVLLEIPDLELIDHFPILAAVAGILLALLNEDMINFKSQNLTEVPRTTRIFVMEPSFQINSLYFMLGDTKIKQKNEKPSKPFSFANYPDDVTEEEVQRVQDMIEYLDGCRANLPDSKTLSDDDDICTICYAYPIAATFEPCHHQTCRICIDRHLLNSTECFFCKVTIEKVVDLSGNVLHDFTSEAPQSEQTA